MRTVSKKHSRKLRRTMRPYVHLQLRRPPLQLDPKSQKLRNRKRRRRRLRRRKQTQRVRRTKPPKKERRRRQRQNPRRTIRSWILGLCVCRQRLYPTMEVLYYPYPLSRIFFSMLKLVATFKWSLVRIHADVYRIQMRKKKYRLESTTPSRRKARESTFNCSVNSLLPPPRLPKMLRLPPEPNIRHLCLPVQLLRL